MPPCSLALLLIGTIIDYDRGADESAEWFRVFKVFGGVLGFCA